MKCFACGGESFEQRCVELKSQVGRYIVIDKSNQAPVCTACGEYELTAEAMLKAEQRAAEVVLAEGKLDSEVLRDTRKALMLKQTELADSLGVDVATVSRWENDKQPMQPMIRQALLGLLRGELHPGDGQARLKAS